MTITGLICLPHGRFGKTMLGIKKKMEIEKEKKFTGLLSMF